MMKRRTWLVTCCIALALWHDFSVRHLQFVGGIHRVPPPPRLGQVRATSREWATPQDLTARISDSPSASVVLEVLQSQHGNPDLDLICIAAAWLTIAKLQRTVTPALVADPYWQLFVESTRRLLRLTLIQDPTNSPRACSNLFWAAASLKQNGLLWPCVSELEEDFAEGVVATAYFMNRQHVANAVWSCGRLELSSSALEKVMNPLMSRLPDVAEELKPQDFGNLLWAAGKLGKASPQLLEAMPLLAEVMPDQIDTFGPQDVSSILKSISMLPADASAELLGLVPRLVSQAREVLPHTTSRQMALACWGLAVCGHSDAQLLKLCHSLKVAVVPSSNTH